MSDGAATPPEEISERYGAVARLFHWTIAIAVLGQIPAGIAMTSEPLQAWADPLFVFHKGLGVVLLVAVGARLVWRVRHPRPPFPDFMPPLEQRIAHWTHIAIYGLLLVMAVSGYVRTIGDGFPIEDLCCHVAPLTGTPGSPGAIPRSSRPG